MWKIDESGNARNTENGDEIFVKSKNRLIRVYYNNIIIAWYSSRRKAKNYVENLVTYLNGLKLR